LPLGSFKLSSRFLQDKVPHEYPRILPEMTQSRFAAMQSPTVAAMNVQLMCQPGKLPMTGMAMAAPSASGCPAGPGRFSIGRHRKP
jgi:hypothetical protein